MKALGYFGKEDLRFVDLPTPEVGATDVLLQVKKVGICGTDLHIYHGGMQVPTPLVMGHEFVGDVVAVGTAVTQVKVGDRAVAEHVVGCGACWYCQKGRKNLCVKPVVIGLHRAGALAEYMAIPADLVFALPADLSYDEGVLVEPLSIAVYAVQKSGLKVGQSVAVVGQGPIGLFVDYVVKEAGGLVVGIDTIDARLQFARKQGLCDFGLQSKSENLLEQVQKISAMDGVDLVFEAVGIEATAALSIELARRGGSVVLLGVFEHLIALNMMQVVKKELLLSGSWTCLNSFESTIRLLQEKKGNVGAFITHRYRFDDAIRAFQEASSYDQNRVKSVIEM
jgi:L-gulonate 5-dehydrogenase